MSSRGSIRLPAASPISSTWVGSAGTTLGTPMAIASRSTIGMPSYTLVISMTSEARSHDWTSVVGGCSRTVCSSPSSAIRRRIACSRSPSPTAWTRSSGCRLRSRAAISIISSGILLLDPSAEGQHVQRAGLERHRSGPVGIELLLGVDPRVDHLGVHGKDAVLLEDPRQVPRRHGPRVDEVAVARRHVADVPAAVGLLDVQLHEDARGVRKRDEVGQQVERRGGCSSRGRRRSVASR